MSGEIVYDMKKDVDALAEKVKAIESGPGVQNVLWSGGFDSTAIILRHLRAGLTIQPYYMMHSDGWEKCKREIVAQEDIRRYLGNPVKLRKPIIWDYDQFQRVPGARILLSTLDELADALNLSHQYSALRFCKDVTGFQEPLQVGVVKYDELWTNWERIRGNDSFGGPLKKFFAGFEFPVWDKMKRDLWDENSPMEQEVLRRTFSCERADGERRSCVQRGVEYKDRCIPCQHRIPEVG